jgi:hypothetical protein
VRLILLCLLLTGCRKEGGYTWQSIEEIFCDGTTVTVIATSEEVRTSKFVLEHGSGRHDEITRWAAMVRWSLPEARSSGRAEPQHASALDRRHALARDDSGASVPPFEYRAFSGRDAILCFDSAVGKLSLRPPDDPAGETRAEARVDPLHGPSDVLVTRSGRHLLATRRGRPVILSTSNLESVREVEPSPAFADFEGRFARVEDHARFLTDDLRYLVKVPFNAGEPQGHNHCKAVIYDLERDATHEVALALGEGATAIEDLEHVGGQLLFLVDFMPRAGGRQLDTRRAVVDARSSVFAWLSENLFHDASDLSERLFWDPARQRVAAWKEGDNGNYDGTLESILVTEHDYGSGTTQSFELDWANTAQLLGRR